jgi:hypothetical protein
LIALLFGCDNNADKSSSTDSTGNATTASDAGKEKATMYNGGYIMTMEGEYPFKIDPIKIKDIKILGTVLGGKSFPLN